MAADTKPKSETTGDKRKEASKDETKYASYEDDDVSSLLLPSLQRLTKGLPRRELQSMVSEAQTCEEALVKEIQQLENNISYISNVSDDNPLVMNVRNNIAGFKAKLDVWKAKLEYLKKLDY